MKYDKVEGKVVFLLGTNDAIDLVGMYDEEKSNNEKVVLHRPLNMSYKEGNAEFSLNVLPLNFGINLAADYTIEVRRERIIMLFVVDAADGHSMVEQYRAAVARMIAQPEEEKEEEEVEAIKVVRPQNG